MKKTINIESLPGIILFFTAILAFILANSPISDFYFSLLKLNFFGLTLKYWINDGLMAIFFFLVGLEIKKEIVIGHLSTPRQAALPIVAAIGGMLLPALFYLTFNYSIPEAARGWGIPMATDIAFAIGVLALFGPRVPLALKVFLLAVAIVDDLGAILVIAFFYTNEIRGSGLSLAFVGLGVAALLQYSGVRSYLFYIIMGVIVWIGFLYSGIHATIAGVLLGLLTPLNFPVEKNSKETFSPLEDLTHKIHPWVSFSIMPIFAFFNSGINLSGVNLLGVMQTPIHYGIVLGLFLGKPLGVFLLSFIAYKFGLVVLPKEIKLSQILAVGFLAGIGFTMSLFISGLALSTELEIYSKTGIIFGSILSGIVGSVLLMLTLRK